MSDMPDRLHEMLDDLAVPLYVAERPAGQRHFVFSLINKAHRQASGMGSRDLNGRGPFDILPVDSAERLEQRMRNCLAQRVPVHFSKRLLQDGQTLHWRGLVQPLPDPTHPDRVLGLGLPVTQAANDRLVQVMLREFALRCTAALMSGAMFHRELEDLGASAKVVAERPVFARAAELAERLEELLLDLARTSHTLCRLPDDQGRAAQA